MKTVNLYEAKTHLSRLVEEAQCGEDVVIAKNGKPLVRLVPVAPSKPSDYFGIDRGKVWMSPDFDEPLEDFKEYMEP
jgi:prevent-host-death family protein